MAGSVKKITILFIHCCWCSAKAQAKSHVSLSNKYQGGYVHCITEYTSYSAERYLVKCVSLSFLF